MIRRTEAMACLLLAWCLPPPPSLAAEPPRIELARQGGEAVAVEPEDLTSIQALPLVNVKRRLEKQFHEGFVSLCKIHVAQGEVVTGTHTLVDGPMRLTVYQISKVRKGHRQLRVLASGFHPKGDIATFTSPIDDLEENVFLVTAEKVAADTELNSHLQYMNTQGNLILLKGYSTNWGMTKLKFELSGKAPDKAKGKNEGKKDEAFVRDADWLIDRLLNPQWVALIRVDRKGAKPAR
jgi:hypothetical protein